MLSEEAQARRLGGIEGKDPSQIQSVHMQYQLQGFWIFQSILRCQASCCVSRLVVGRRGCWGREELGYTWDFSGFGWGYMTWEGFLVRGCRNTELIVDSSK